MRFLLTTCAAVQRERVAAEPARGPQLDALDEFDAALDCAPDRTRGGDLLQPLELRLAQVAGQADVDLEPPRRRVVVVVDVDLDLVELPLLRARVHHEGRRDARGERSREELVRRRRASVTADALGLVGDQTVPAVDQDLLAERAGYRVGGGGQAHGGSMTVSPGRLEMPSGRPLKPVRRTTGDRQRSAGNQCSHAVPYGRTTTAATAPMTTAPAMRRRRRREPPSSSRPVRSPRTARGMRPR